MKPTLTAILRRLVTESGVTLSELARQTGVPQPTLYEFINGRGGNEPRDLTMQNAQRLIDYFGVKVVVPKAAKKPKPTTATQT